MQQALAESVRLKTGKLTDQQLNRILDRLDQAEPAGQPHDERRASPRMRYRVRHLVVHINQNGIEAAYLVPSRNISCTGMAFLHRHALAAGTPCRVIVVLPQAEWVHVSARVVRCKQVEEALHEIGLQFDTPIALPD